MKNTADEQQKGINAKTGRVKITHEAKATRLLSLSEDEFRDAVVREIFYAQNFRDYRDLCGPAELGKDCVMVKGIEFNEEEICVIQTKKGKLNMASKPADNAANIITQLRMALTSPITLLNQPRKVLPHRIYLCASGKVNDRAREYIAQQLNDSRVRILDADDIIQAIDAHYPTFWINIKYQKQRYLAGLQSQLLALRDIIPLRTAPNPELQPFSNEAYVPQTLYRFTDRVNKREVGKQSGPQIEEIEDVKLLTSRYKIGFIVGEGGSGKTTLLRRLALLMCESSLHASSNELCHIPVLLRARDLEKDASISEAAANSVCQVYGGEDSVIGNDDFNEGRVTILIDGIDELTSRDTRDSFLHQVVRFHIQWPKCPIFAVTRPLQQVRTFAAVQSIPLFQISEFSLKQAARIIARTADGAPQKEAASREIIRRLQDVHGMKLTPMIVTVFASTPNFQTSDIPPNITAIFKKFANLMLGEWDTQKGLNQQFEYDLKHRILAKIAFDWHEKCIFDAEKNEFRSQILFIMDDLGIPERSDDVSDEIFRSGLLTFEGNRVRFRHLLFQEYFAGVALEDIKSMPKKVCDERWRNPIVFSYGARPDKGKELDDVVRALHDLPLDGKYAGSVTVGLALQACYMTSARDRDRLFGQVLAILASCFAGYEETSSKEQYPLNSFIFKFLEARSAVSSDLLLRLQEPTIPDTQREYLQFLKFAGHMDSGHTKEVVANVIDFDPTNRKLLLGLYLIAIFVVKLRQSTNCEQDAAKNVVSSIHPRISDLIKAVVDEFNGYVLELRNGKMHVTDAVLPSATGQFEIEFDE